MNKDILNKVTEIKNQLLSDGFIIEGVFGSYSREDNNLSSDIDILYELDRAFKDNYKGFKAIARLDDIQKKISEYLNIQADLVQKSTLGEIASRYILPEVHYV
jgi:predicted nucleotidyltransferase